MNNPSPISFPRAHSRWRWAICALLFAATTFNFIDRQILSLLKPLLDEQFGFHCAASHRFDTDLFLRKP